MKRHLTIALVAGLFGFVAIPLVPKPSASWLPYSALIVATLSAVIWFFMSVLVVTPRLKDWLICGVVSPYIGFPFAFALVRDEPFYSQIVPGVQIALFGAWLLIPGGILMALIAHGISGAFEPKKTAKK